MVLSTLLIEKLLKTKGIIISHVNGKKENIC